ncbi:uncharacterized protein PAC_07100 [Phialocephala subalpina]|uniref:Uncharacterized protein n=1 Tax=Phialocephala subalpina TaxID=576137 RepID=A0A1L7WWR4_9HELO|nr:uncharacterized protein PAC_07100 [Phialocephala subalpina]
MGELDKAQTMLEAADAIRSRNGDVDAVCTQNNLGRLWEMKGGVVKAQEWRTKNPDKMICSTSIEASLAKVPNARTHSIADGNARKPTGRDTMLSAKIHKASVWTLGASG